MRKAQISPNAEESVEQTPIVDWFRSNNKSNVIDDVCPSAQAQTVSTTYDSQRVGDERPQYNVLLDKHRIALARRRHRPDVGARAHDGVVARQHGSNAHRPQHRRQSSAQESLHHHHRRHRRQQPTTLTLCYCCSLRSIYITSQVFFGDSLISGVLPKKKPKI
jgi:hypothetical protein